jgi:type I restriction enzyme S subunit
LGELAKFEIPAVRLERQKAFADRISKLNALRSSSLAHLAQLDELFASLQHRAFAGQL